MSDLTDISSGNARCVHEAPSFLGCLLSVADFKQCLSELGRSPRPGRAHAVVVAQLLGAQRVKERHGDVAHRNLLNEVVGLWLPVVRHGDLMARWDDRTFTLLLESCVPERSQESARFLRTAMKNFKFRWQGTDILVGVTVGPVLSINNEDDAGGALRYVDEVSRTTGVQVRRCDRDARAA